MDISIIIPLYNKAEFIERALRSALHQTSPAAQVIVVDDGSSDGSLEVVKRFGSSVLVIEQANAGPSAARNRGVDHATSPYLLFLDGDDELLPNAVAEHQACFGGADDVDLSLSSYQKVLAGAVVDTFVLADRLDDSSRHFAYRKGFSVDLLFNVHSGCICVSRTLFERIGRWDEELRCWEISDFLIRAGMGSRNIGLHRTISLHVHLTEDGQFARTHRDARYSLHFAEKVIAVLDAMSTHDRGRMLVEIRTFAYEFWRSGQLDAYHELCVRLWRGARRSPDFGAWIGFGLLPTFFLSWVYRARYGTEPIGR